MTARENHPRTLNILAMSEMRVRFVISPGNGAWEMVKWNWLVLVFYCIPRVLVDSFTSDISCTSCTSRSSGLICWRTAYSLEFHLCNRNLPLENTPCNSFFLEVDCCFDIISSSQSVVNIKRLLCISSIVLYILLTSAVTAILLNRNLRRSSTSDKCTVGPTNKWSFNETPDMELAEASKTACTFVVVLDPLYTTCKGR